MGINERMQCVTCIVTFLGFVCLLTALILYLVSIIDECTTQKSCDGNECFETDTEIYCSICKQNACNYTSVCDDDCCYENSCINVPNGYLFYVCQSYSGSNHGWNRAPHKHCPSKHDMLIFNLLIWGGALSGIGIIGCIIFCTKCMEYPKGAVPGVADYVVTNTKINEYHKPK
eukprot:296325_1